MVTKVLKRDGSVQDFNVQKIEDAIFKAILSAGGKDRTGAIKIAKSVAEELNQKYTDKIPEVEDIQDVVERQIIKAGHDQVAKNYILYREKRRGAREDNDLAGATIKMFSQYLSEDDFAVKNNANMQKSVAGLINHINEEFTKKYWLNEIYPADIASAHKSGALHLHDLGFFGAYCVGWDLKQVLLEGYRGPAGKISSKPAKHLRAFLGQVVNCTFSTQFETAGAQAWSSFDTFVAPFVRADNLTFKQVKQCMQEFIFNLNVATRVGFQTPFSNLTFDITVPKTLANESVILGGLPQETTYSDYQAEMDVVNKAFCEVMLEGDANGRVFSFPIPTINVTRDLNWESDVMNKWIELTCKYGVPYFANYINSDLNPEDAVSMCCRLRLDMTELRKRGGGMFGSNPSTGSIGVVTINLPRIGYKSKTEKEYFEQLEHLCDLAKTSLEIKRKVVEKQSDNGLYPYCTFYLKDIKARSGEYWSNHFNTIGIVGMHESLLNFMGVGIETEKGQAFAVKVLEFMREKMKQYQKETGHIYNLEATPAEGVSPRLANIDKMRYPDIITAGGEAPYYTNSTHLPVGYTDDIFESVRLQDSLQCLYTGGTVLHMYLGEKIDDPEACKRLIQKVFAGSKMPYISITPTFSICRDHGYIGGEYWTCPTCNAETEVWSRVVGFLRPVADFNAGKRKEYKERKKYDLFKSLNKQMSMIS